MSSLTIKGEQGKGTVLDMKKFFAVISMSIAFVFLTAFVSHGAEKQANSVEYVITYEDGEYVLSVADDSAQSALTRSSDFQNLILHLEGRGDAREVVLVGISVQGDVELSGEYMLSGSFKLTDGVLSILGNISFEDIKIELSSSSVRIKKGRIGFDKSEIISDSTAIILDYSAGAEFIMNSGSISVDSKNSAIELKKGSVSICGGSVTNASGVAINTRSTLCLSGKPEIRGLKYGVLSDTPITLSYMDREFEAPLSLCYLESFSEGEINCVFYSASESALKNITFWDVNNSEQKLKFFESYQGIGEKKFGAVYLPFTVGFYSDGSLVKTQELLRGATLDTVSVKDKPGYEFVGWSRSEDGLALFDFAEKVDKSFNLYAEYDLLPPTFNLSSLEFTYDGKTHSFGICDIEHPLIASAVLNFNWMKDGKALSSYGQTLNLSRVSESGKYSCIIKFTYGTDSVEVKTPQVNVTVNKATVEIPKIAEKIYNGERQTPDIYSTSFYKVADAGGVSVGVYPVKLTLVDPENCVFSDGKDVAYTDFRILKAENFWTEELSVFDIYEGMLPSHKATSRFGEVKFLYSKDENGAFISEYPTAAGIYYCVAKVSGTENYGELTSKILSFEVIEEKIIGLAVKKLPEKCVYVAFDEFTDLGLELVATYNSARSEVVDLSRISYTYQTEENFRYGDNAIIASYLDMPIPIPLTVNKAEYDISEIIFVDTEAVFNGKTQSADFKGKLPTGLDGIELFGSVIGGGINSGEYTVTLKFTSESKNYKIPEDMVATLKILPYETEVIYSSLDFVYDGMEKCPTAYYIDIHGRKVDLSVIGARSLAGEYSASVVSADKNYTLIGETVSFKIRKADYDMSDAVWTQNDFVYDGKEKQVTLSGLPNGVSVVGYSDNKAISAGIYIAKAVLLYDSMNYNAPSEQSFEWEIKKAEYDLTSFEFKDSSYDYSGEERFPVLVGEMPEGIDGHKLNFSYSGGAVNVSDGRLKVEIIFSTDSKNYKIPEKQYAYVEITPYGIEVNWRDLEFIYNASVHAPKASSDVCEVSVIGGKTDAGTYTATAISLDPNYSIINSKVEFKILKADNKWTLNIEISDIFEGSIPNPKAQSLGGDVRFVYYSDSDDELDSPPNSPGNYYVMAFCDGNNNYKPLSSEKIKFSVIKIIPVSMSVKLIKTSYVAFDKVVSDDIEITVLCNDGSSFLADAENLKIGYINSDSLRFGDEYITVGYLDFVSEVPISVRKADYDMKDVFWDEGIFTYDGQEKYIGLNQLPSGVSILEYVGNGAVSAGEYDVNVIFEYDDENYNSPVIPTGKLVIEKRIVAFPIFDDLTYNGSAQAPDISESELYTMIITPGVSAGSYAITLKLSDLQNYTFEDSSSEATLYYRIEPLKLTITLSDVEKYKLSDMPLPDYAITEGELLQGDALDLIFEYGEAEVTCSSSNTNYLLTVIPGRIIRYSTPSKDTAIDLFIIILIILTLLLILLVLILKRNKVVHLLSIIKCRISPTVTVVEEPKKTLEKEAFKKENYSVSNSESIEEKLSVKAECADGLISDSLAKDLLRKESTVVETEGNKKRIINVDTLSDNFTAGEKVDVNKLKDMSLIPYDTAYIKVLARGMIDKPLKVHANDFSLAAVKMIALTGGESVKVVTVKKKNPKDKNTNFDEKT